MKILPFNVAVSPPCAHFRFSEHVKFAIPRQSCEVPAEGGFEIYHPVGGCCMLGSRMPLFYGGVRTDRAFP